MTGMLPPITTAYENGSRVDRAVDLSRYDVTHDSRPRVIVGVERDLDEFDIRVCDDRIYASLHRMKRADMEAVRDAINALLVLDEPQEATA